MNWLASEPDKLEGDLTRNVFLRVEPQVFDLTDKVFLTSPKSNAVILVAEVDAASRVYSLEPLSKWLLLLYNNNFLSHGTLENGLDTLTNLDAYDANGNNLPHVFYTLLRDDRLDEADRVRCIQAVPRDVINVTTKPGAAVGSFLGTFAKEGSPLVKAAAQKKLDELFPKK